MNRYSDERRRAVSVVESLRAGVPTRVSTRELPDLRPDLTEGIKEDLNLFREDRFPPGRLIWGQYGQGKTHVLTVVEHLALDMNFAVSMISLSREVSCHSLFPFYSRVASVIRPPDSAVSGIQRVLNQRKASDLPGSPIQTSGRYVHPLPAIIFEDYFHAEGEDQDILYGDLMGTPVSREELRRIHRAYRTDPLPRFERNFRKSEHASAYFGLMADAIRFCGHRGWVILIDEIELVGRLGKASRLQAYRNLNWLLNWSGTMKYPIYTLGAVASSLQAYIRPGGKGPKKDDRTALPRLAEERFGPTARDEIVRFFEKALSPECRVVGPPEEGNLVELLDKLVELHGVAHNWNAELRVRDLVESIGAPPTRTHIRATLEALDIRYIYQETIAPRPADLVESTIEEDEEGEGEGPKKDEEKESNES